MAFRGTFIVKGSSHGFNRRIYLPKDWELKRGDMVTVYMDRNGMTYSATLRMRACNNAAYFNVPPSWKTEYGDLVEIKVVFANVPQRQEDPYE